MSFASLPASLPVCLPVCCLSRATGDDDIFLIKYSSSGVVQWTREAGTPDADEGWGVAVSADGHAYVTGVTDGSLNGQTWHGACPTPHQLV